MRSTTKYDRARARPSYNSLRHAKAKQRLQPGYLMGRCVIKSATKGKPAKVPTHASRGRYLLLRDESGGGCDRVLMNRYVALL